jgi:pimeloyl-ACP methyl ester carboxylesterase
MSRSGETVCNGIRLSWESFGDGTPVLLIAGTGAPPITWQVEGFAPALVESGYRVVTFANRGIEPSESPPGPYSVAEMAVDAAQLIEGLDLSPCRVVGYSLGGQIAEELCYRYPDYVDEVVLLASAGRSTAFLRLHVRAQVDLATAMDPPVPSQVARDRLLFTQPSSVLQDDDDTVEFVRSTMEASPPWTNPGRFGQWAAVAGWVNDEQRTERWRRLTQRCLLIAFEHDLAFPPSRVREAAAAMPNARFMEIAAAAHGGLLTHGEEVTQAVREFFNGPSCE